MVLVKNFENFPSFIGKISQQNVFDDILEREKAFLDSKIRKLKKSKNHDISKGVSPWFGQKFGIFHVFIFGKISQQVTRVEESNLSVST